MCLLLRLACECSEAALPGCLRSPPPRRRPALSRRPAANPPLLRPLPRCVPRPEGSPLPRAAASPSAFKIFPQPFLCHPARLHLPPQPGFPPCPPRPGCALCRGGGSSGRTAAAVCLRSFVRSLAPSFVYFFPSGDVKWLLRRGDFVVRGKLSCLLENGLWRSEICPLPPFSGSPCFYCHTEAVTRGSRRPSRLCVLASRCQSFCLPAASVLILFLKIFSESFQSGGST